MSAPPILARLAQVRKTTSGWSARCPAHDDQNPSLSITVGDDGRVLLHCHAGCSFDAVLNALGMQSAALSGEGRGNEGHAKASKNGRATFATSQEAVERTLSIVQRLRGPDWSVKRTYSYLGREGAEVAQVVRFEPSSGGAKDFRPVSPDGQGRWRIGDPVSLWPLFQLPSLRDRERVYVVEGEKAADAGASIGLATTTSAHGARAPAKSDWKPLAGREVVVLPDNDGAGESYAQEVVRILLALDPPAKVRVLALPELPDGGDIVEFINARLAVGETHDQVRQSIEQLTAAAPLVSSVSPSTKGPPASVSSGSGGPGRSQHEWPLPKDLPGSLPPILPLDTDLLAPPLRRWADDIAERFQCPTEYLAISIMVGLSAVLGRKVAIRPKRLDDWTVVANLWGMGIGRPGWMKTPAIREALRVLEQIERKYGREFDHQEFEFKAAQLLAERRRRQFTIVKNGAASDPQIDMEDARECLRSEPIPPSRRRLLVNDCTVEKLGEILRDNPNGVLVYRDELIGFLQNLDREGQEGARSFFLEAWDGKGSYTFDRIGRGTVEIPYAIVSVIGGVQSGPVQDYLGKAIRGGTGDDGLMQRFQLAVWPDASGVWTNVDRRPDSEAREQAFEIYERLERATAIEMAAELEFEGGIPFLHFTPAAQEAFDGWRQSLEERIRREDDHPAIESHLCKYRSLLPSIALIDHLVDKRGGPVGVESVERGIRWNKLLESHARRIYAGAVVQDIEAARRIATKIRQKHLKDRFVARDLYRHGWAGLTDRDLVVSALQVLVDHDWLRAETDRGTGGAPATYYLINPRVQELPARRHDATDRKPASLAEGQASSQDADGTADDEVWEVVA
jgi:hypothetical protein